MKKLFLVAVIGLGFSGVSYADYAQCLATTQADAALADQLATQEGNAGNIQKMLKFAQMENFFTFAAGDGKTVSFCNSNGQCELNYSVMCQQANFASQYPGFWSSSVWTQVVNPYITKEDGIIQARQYDPNIVAGTLPILVCYYNQAKMPIQASNCHIQNN
jgi:hypothetical protein